MLDTVPRAFSDCRARGFIPRRVKARIRTFDGRCSVT
jgi:hypothetical protein